MPAPLPEQTAATSEPAAIDATRAQRASVLLALVFAATWFISTAMAAHLPRLLELNGASLATAVAVGALVGPAQVAGRLLEFGVLRRVHPLLSARLAAVMHPLGAALLGIVGAPAAAMFAIAARRGQRHPDHRQGHLAARALRSAGLRSSTGPADDPCAHCAGLGAMVVRSLPRSLWCRRAVALRLDRLVGLRGAARLAQTR